MQITYWTAEFRDASGREFAGSVNWDKNAPRLFTSRLAPMVAPQMEGAADYVSSAHVAPDADRLALVKLGAKHCRAAAKRRGLRFVSQKLTRFAAAFGDAGSILFSTEPHAAQWLRRTEDAHATGTGNSLFTLFEPDSKHPREESFQVTMTGEELDSLCARWTAFRKANP